MRIQILQNDISGYWDVYFGDLLGFSAETKERAEFWAEVLQENWNTAHAVPTRDIERQVSEFEKSLILATLEETDGNKMQAAKLLGIKRTTLIDRCHRFGIETKGATNEKLVC